MKEEIAKEIRQLKLDIREAYEKLEGEQERLNKVLNKIISNEKPVKCFYCGKNSYEYMYIGYAYNDEIKKGILIREEKTDLIEALPICLECYSGISYEKTIPHHICTKYVKLTT